MAVGQSLTTTGTTVNITSRQDGSLFRVDRHPRNMQSVFDNVVFTASNPQATAVTTQAGLSATTPALTLYNPTASGVNLVLIAINIAITASPAAATTLSLAWNLASAAAPTATTVATVTSNNLGLLTTPAGQASRVATLAAAPVAFCYLGGILAAASTGLVKIERYFDGEYILAPGTCISVQSTTAVAVLCELSWKEIPTTAV